MNSIILIDDQQSFIDDFKNAAFAKGIIVAPKKSLEGLKELLPAYIHKYAAVVLDIKCLLTNNQQKEHASFITAALSYLDTTSPRFPRFILTGDESEFDTLKGYYTQEKMFIKKPDDQDRLLDELLKCVQNATPMRIKRENVEVFDAFERSLLPAHKEVTVLSIIERYDENKVTNFRGVIGDIREIHEEVYKSINARNKAVVPNRFLNGNGSPTFTNDFYKHLLGNPDSQNKYTPSTSPYQDSTISNHTKSIHSICSEYLHGTSRTKFQISSYTIKSLINSLMEMIIWSKQY
jgi:hypothetical protein